MEAYMELDSATCAENFYASAASAEGYVSGITGKLAGFVSTWLGLMIINAVAMTSLAVISFGILGAAYLPITLITLMGGAVVAYWSVLIPKMQLIARYHLVSMKGYYSCAIGETGFTEEGQATFNIAYLFMMASLDNFELFTTIPFGAMLNNGGIVNDLDAMLMEYATKA